MIGDIINVVISDLHIGHPDSTFSLSDAENIFKHFVQEIKEIDSVEKLILLGDVFKNWDSSDQKFEIDVDFRRTTFQGTADFRKATFQGSANFSAADFHYGILS